MPFYTRVWQINNNGEAVTSNVLSMDNTDAWIEENKVVPIWDESLGQNVGEYKKDNLIYRCWLEDEQSLILKLQLMQENRLAGGAFWKNGQDKRSVWDIIITYMR
jgi:spore germination protein YaaH